MARLIAGLLLLAALLINCGPDKRECTGVRASGGAKPAFAVVLQLKDRPLAPDTVVTVAYGGTGKDEYSLAAPSADHEVIFCRPSQRDGSPLEASAAAAAGAAGDEPAEIDALSCDLWTGGFTHLEVRATGQDLFSHDLYPRDHECTVTEILVMDSPDAG